MKRATNNDKALSYHCGQRERRSKSPLRHSGARLFLGASPESILPMVVMDSGLAPLRFAPRNDEKKLAAIVMAQDLFD